MAEDIRENLSAPGALVEIIEKRSDDKLMTNNLGDR